MTTHGALMSYLEDHPHCHNVAVSLWYANPRAPPIWVKIPSTSRRLINEESLISGEEYSSCISAIATMLHVSDVSYSRYKAVKAHKLLFW